MVQSFFFPSALYEVPAELSFGVVNEPLAVTGLVATIGADIDCEMGLFRLGGGLLPSTMFRRRVRDVADADEDHDEMRGCLLNIFNLRKNRSLWICLAGARVLRGVRLL